MSANIKYQKGKVDSMVRGLRVSVGMLLSDKAAEFDTISALMSVSKADQITALQAQLSAEKQAVVALADFYLKLLEMIHNASNDVDLAESHYAQGHVSGGES